ncbi:MAG TPA: methionine--tRNA ligase [Ktedonobacterales bacterium]|nr:methionine--tRNA ligase [Ktedonobacterales bacterium]
MAEKFTPAQTTKRARAHKASTARKAGKADQPGAQPWYITTAIPYVNARPHIGFALEIILTDAVARYHRLVGDDVRFLTGADENSLKNVRAAEQEGVPTQELVDRNAAFFRGLREPLNLSFDDFIRTSVDPRHAAGVQKLWEACARNGDVYTRSYQGLYCVGCEQFYTEDELINGLCPEHHTRPELVEEENYFFRLSRYGERLAQLIESDQLRIVPQSRKNEALSFIRGGLEDFSISRSQARAHGWGIPVPGDPSQVIYVWYDALGNYITALGYADDGPLYQRYWVNNPSRTHVIGKGILRFHTIYWPAMLLSAGVPLPTTVYVHGYVTVEGEKISKTLGNVVDPVALVRQYGTDPVRYYLLREIPSTDDGDFALERFIRANNLDLADKLGNLLNRTLSMVGRYYRGSAPAPGPREPVDDALIGVAKGLGARVATAMANFAPHEALAAIWELVDAANKYVEDTKPWALAKERKTGAQANGQGDSSPAEADRLGAVLYNLLEALRLIALYITPFLPETAAAMTTQLGLTDAPTTGTWDERIGWGGYPTGTKTAPGGILFTKRELPGEEETLQAALTVG